MSSNPLSLDMNSSASAAAAAAPTPRFAPSPNFNGTPFSHLPPLSSSAFALPQSSSSNTGNKDLKQYTFPVSQTRTGITPNPVGNDATIGLLLKELFVRGSPDLVGNRTQLEDALGKTASQMIFSGISSIDRSNLKIEVDSDMQNFKTGASGKPDNSVSLVSYINEEIVKLKSLDSNTASLTARQQEKVASDRQKIIIKQQQKENLFKKYFSWLTSVSMPRIEIVKNENLLSEMITNEDEHVLPFAFMLLFGGRLGTVPSTGQNYIGYPAIEYAISNYGSDPTQISPLLNDKTAVELAKAMGFNEEGLVDFFMEFFDLNYDGMYYSEKVSNQIKSNYMFLKLVFESIPGTDRGIYVFKPSEHRINEFCDMMQLYKESINSRKISGLKEVFSKTKNRERTSRTAFYNVEKYVDKFFIDGWQNIGLYYNRDNALQTMTHILTKLCETLNKNLVHRLFFNLVMNKVTLYRIQGKITRDKISGLSGTTSRIYSEQRINRDGSMRPLPPQQVYSRASSALREGSISRSASVFSNPMSVSLPNFTNVPPELVRKQSQKRVSASPRRPKKSKKSKKTNTQSNVGIEEEFIKYYIVESKKDKVWIQSFIDDNDELRRVLTQTTQRGVSSLGNSAFARLSESDTDSDMSDTGFGGGKRKAKRKKKTKRKNKKKYKKKTRRK